MADGEKTLSKKELEEKLERLAKGAKARGKQVAAGKSRGARIFARKGAVVVTMAGVGVTHKVGGKRAPKAVKAIDGGVGALGLAIATVADIFGFEGLANAADVVGTGFGTGFLKDTITPLEPKGSEAPASKPAAQQAPQQAEQSAAKPASGEIYPESVVGNAGPFEAAASGRAPAAAHQAARQQRLENKPFRALLQERARNRRAFIHGLQQNGIQPSAAQVQGMIDAADSAVSGFVQYNPETGEFVDLLASTGESVDTGALNPVAVALRAMAALSDRMVELDKAPELLAAPPKTSGCEGLTDEEMIAATAAGILDPLDVEHINTSGMDDGRYLHTSGKEVSADDVRWELADSYNNTGAISDRWEAYKGRVQERKQGRAERARKRLEAKRQRVKLKEQAKTLKLDQKIDKKEAPLNRTVLARETQAANQASSNAALEASVAAENAPSSSAAAEAPVSTDPAVDSSTNWSEGENWG